MEPFVIALLVLIAAPLFWIMVTYNRFIRYRNMIEENWSGIDVALKRRFNLIPNLVKATKGYSEHEDAVLTRGSTDPLSNRKYRFQGRGGKPDQQVLERDYRPGGGLSGPQGKR